MHCGDAKALAIIDKQVTEFCLTEAARVGQNSLKDGLKVAWRTGDRAEYLGGRCSSASERCPRTSASSRVRASSCFFNSLGELGLLLTRAFAFVPVERSLWPRVVRLFAPLRDKVTSSAQSLVPPFAPIAACGPPKSPILPELCRTHLGLPDASAEFEPGILVLLQCGALRRPALPGMQSREHDPKRLQGPRCEMQHKRQRHFAFVLRRRLTWFYPQVCQNQALSGASTFLFCPSMSATASADC